MKVISFLVKLHKDFFLAHHHLLLRFPEIKPWVYFIAEKLDVYVVCVALFLVMWFLWDAAKKESIKRILFIGKEMFHIVFAVGAAWLVSYCMKIFFAAPRPFLRFPGEVDKLFHYGGFNSFPSGHATLFMALAIMISLHHKRIGYVFIFFALIISLARVIAGVHFPIDIFVGWFLGGVLSYLQKNLILGFSFSLISLEKKENEHILKGIMWKTRIIALVFVALGIFLGTQVYRSEINGTKPFKLGLDLKGGSYLVYEADISDVAPDEVRNSMDSLRDVIERRINAFGIAEPNVQTESSAIGAKGQERLVIELPGVTDIDEAKKMIGQTPYLEFRTEAPKEEQARINAEIQKISENSELTNEQKILHVKNLEDQRYVATELTGKYLEKSQLQFSQTGVQGGGNFASTPIIGLQFNKEGGNLFEKITSENVGKTIAIYLDGILVSAPRVNTAISGGRAIIEGSFSLEEAKEVVGELNSGALPIPIKLISTNTIGPSLGAGAVKAGVTSGLLGLLFVALILVLWYRLPGLIAVIALGVYSAIMLWLFKFIPVTLTSAGIAGFIISIGIAVDANILIFERMKEELAEGRNIYTATKNGFARAWASIRDANISSIISAVILFWFGTALIKGFALTFGLGIIVSMFSAITVTRAILLSLSDKNTKESSKIMRFLVNSGFNK